MSASAAWAASAGSFATSSASHHPGTVSAGRSSPSRPASRWHGPDPAVLEKPEQETSSSVGSNINSKHHGGLPMFNALLITSLYVLDQNKALDFYVGKLGLEVNTDQDLGFMRWLTVNVPGDTRQILLERPGAPGLDEKTAEQARELVTKGGTGGHLFFTTDDCWKTYEELRAKGVEFTEEPTERPYGIDCGLRDPFGNHIRFSQPLHQVATRTASATKANR